MKQALLLMVAAVLFISCGEKKDPAAETKAKNIAAFKLFASILLAGDLAGLDRVIIRCPVWSRHAKDSRKGSQK
jgi:hypothetical protein